MNKKIEGTIRAVLIDDEERSRNNLRLLLKQYCPNIEVCGEGNDVVSGLSIIREQHPDAVFLDIEMPEYDGFKLIDLIPAEELPQIIFTTAYQQYAIRAFRVSAIDYLLKPIDVEELKAAVQKLREGTRKQEQRLEVLQGYLKETPDKIVVPQQEGYLFLQISDLICLEANRSYTFLHSGNHKKQLVAKPLREFEDILPEEFFFRPHRSFIVNTRRVEKWIKKDGGYLIMSNGMNVPISRKKREEFLKFYPSQLL